MRTSRYEASPGGPRRRRFNEKQREALRWIVEYRFLLTSQLAQLMNLTQNALNKHTRVLKDWGFVYVVPISRGDLDPTLPNDVTRIRGSVEDLLVPTKAGITCLIDNEYISDEAASREPIAFGPQQGMRLAHDSMAHQLRVWLEVAPVSHPGSRVRVWREGREECRIEIPPNPQYPDAPKTVIPDAWFVFEPAEGMPVVGMVEADRGTMTAVEDWEDKTHRYVFLLASGVLSGLTGQKKARILTLAPNEARIRTIAKIVRGIVGTEGPYGDRFLFAPWTELSTKRGDDKFWRLTSGHRTLLAP